jgi:hypothetical protein
VVSRVKRDFACTLTGAFPPALLGLRAQSRLGLEGADTYTQRAIPGSDLPGQFRTQPDGHRLDRHQVLFILSYPWGVLAVGTSCLAQEALLACWPIAVLTCDI